MSHSTLLGKYDLSFESDIEGAKDWLKNHPSDAQRLINEAYESSTHHSYFRDKSGQKYKITHITGHEYTLKEYHS